MKNTTDTALINALESDYELTAVPKLTVEWNMNRYSDVVAENTPLETEEGFEPEFFPIESIVEPLRPTKGINKARVGQSVVSHDYFTKNTPRFYVADANDVYKYWTSPVPSDGTGALIKCRPQIIYSTSVTANKIVLGFENTWASPNSFTVETTTNGTSWTAVPAGNIGNGWEATGQIVLYWTGSSWNTTRPSVLTVPSSGNLRGVRVTVNSLKAGYGVDGTVTKYKNSSGQTFNTDGKNSFLDLIEISARLEVDLSDSLISVNDTFDTSDVSELYPIGTLTSNIASVTLSNIYEDDAGNVSVGLFNRDNDSSPYQMYLEPSVLMNLSYVYDIDGSAHEVQQFKMYTSPWSGDATDSTSIELTDYSKFFQTIVPRASMWENITVAQIIMRLCDSIGFVDYDITQLDTVVDFVIPVFWVDGIQTMWEVLDELAKASQTAIYFDGSGILRVKTRESAFDPDRATDFALSSEDSDSDLANIIRLNGGTSHEANKVTITYKSTNWSEFQNGMPVLQTVWEASDNMTLRAAPVIRNIDPTSTMIYIDSKAVSYWLFTGIMNVQGEFIKWDGKEYAYYTGTGAGTRNVKILKSDDEKSKIDSDTPEALLYKNGWTGGLAVASDGRGYWNSQTQTHSVDASGYSVRHIVNGNRKTSVGGFTHKKFESQVEMESNSSFDRPTDLLIATKGAEVDTPFYYYGARMMLDKAGKKDQRAGIVFNNNGNTEDGYYIEFTPTEKLGAVQRKTTNELSFFTRNNGDNKKLGGAGNRGARPSIVEGIWFNVDVAFAVLGNGDHSIKIWVNGKLQIDTTVSGSQRNSGNGKFGLFTRGKTKASFEYLYAVRRQDMFVPDDFSFLDKVQRAYTGSLMDEWTFRKIDTTRRQRKKTNKATRRFNEMYLDEFGPYAHEIREVDVKFEPSPVLHSRPYITNDWDTAVLEYRSNPFGATFVIANTSRNNAVVNGDDTLSFSGTGDAVNQVASIYGRCLVIADEETIVSENKLQQKKRGVIEAEISSNWIQSEKMAQTVADWVNSQFGYGTETMSADIFGNPLIEIGDIVSVTYPDYGLSAERHFVTGVATTFENGITTTLSLRRVTPVT